MEAIPERFSQEQLLNRIASLEDALTDALLDLRLTRAWIRLMGRPAPPSGGTPPAPREAPATPR